MGSNNPNLTKGLIMFPVTDRKHKQFLNKNAVSQYSNYFLNQFPTIPDPSEELLAILRQFRTLDDLPHIERRSKQKRKRSKINAFVAFRSFYGRDIRSVEKQRQLSKALAKVWKHEKGKSSWKRYATEYSSAIREILFPVWLDRMQTGSYKNIEVKKNDLIVYNTKVEDLYLYTS